MNATHHQHPADDDTAVAEPPAEAGDPPGDAATADAAAAESMDRDDWLCRVGDVARLLREQRRATESEGDRTTEDRS